MSNTYRVEGILRSRMNRFIHLKEGESVSVEEILFSAVKPYRDMLRVLLTVEASSEEEARSKAERFLDSVCTAILLDTNIALDVESVYVVKLIKPRIVKQGKIVEIKAFDTVGLREEISLGLGIGAQHLRGIIERAKSIENTDESLTRFFKWYRRALLTDDPIDRFAYLWIALEIWATYKGYKKGKAREKDKMANTLRNECRFSEEDANNMYGTRSGLFHSGDWCKALEKLPQLEKCLENIYLKAKQVIFQ